MTELSQHLQQYAWTYFVAALIACTLQDGIRRQLDRWLYRRTVAKAKADPNRTYIYKMRLTQAHVDELERLKRRLRISNAAAVMSRGVNLLTLVVDQIGDCDFAVAGANGRQILVESVADPVVRAVISAAPGSEAKPAPADGDVAPAAPDHDGWAMRLAPLRVAAWGMSAGAMALLGYGWLQDGYFSPVCITLAALFAGIGALAFRELCAAKARDAAEAVG